MNRFITRALLPSLALAGIYGSILAARALKQTAIQSQNLYLVDLAGSQIESDLEYETQESRRAFLYALASSDPNEQLPYIDQARAASRRVEDAVALLRLLQEPGIEGCIKDFERSWTAYREARREILADVLEGDVVAAMRVERARGQPAFDAAVNQLHALKSSLAQHARTASGQVDRTLRSCAVGLGAFTLATFLIVALLAKVACDRRAALASLNASNEALTAERELEKSRASILEMVTNHAPLTRTLGAIVKLASKCGPDAGAAIWSAADSSLQFQVAATLPQSLTEALEWFAPSGSGEIAMRIEEFGRLACAQAGRFHLVAADPKALLDASGRMIGILQVFTRPERAALQPAMLDQMVQLASVAIENTLLYNRLAFQAQHDTLTQLPNRLLFQDRVQQAIQLARRHRTQAAVIWIDLDRYKQINDALGHRAGDQVLSEVGRRLTDCLRESDTVARVGGDEFTILAHDIVNAKDAELVAAKVLNAISRPMALGEHEVAITASAGISLFPEHGEDPLTLMRHADLAMYSAKRAGGKLQLFRPALGNLVERRLLVERQLKLALERGEFALEYQPLIDRHGRLNGLEALLRWNNAMLGRVSPAEFIPTAEEMGLILAIGEWVTRAACRDGAAWLQAGYDVPRIAVNASAIQFVDKGFSAMVERASRDHGFPLAKLEIEITETALMNHLDRVIKQIESLRRLGVRFAIDDFGTGYSSLGQLRTLPVDSVKIDRSFIQDLESSGTGSTTLVRGIIALAHNLQLEVVAEGVETEEQLAMLRAMGCDLIQGYFLHKPMPPRAVENLLRQDRRHPDSLSLETHAAPLLPIPA